MLGEGKRVAVTLAEEQELLSPQQAADRLGFLPPARRAAHRIWRPSGAQAARLRVTGRFRSRVGARLRGGARAGRSARRRVVTRTRRARRTAGVSRTNRPRAVLDADIIYARVLHDLMGREPDQRTHANGVRKVDLPRPRRQRVALRRPANAALITRSALPWRIASGSFWLAFRHRCLELGEVLRPRTLRVSA